MWWKPLFLTFQLMTVSVVLAAALGIAGAWAASTVENAGRWGRWIARIFFLSMVAAAAMPMILHAAAWEATAGKFGWLPLTQTGSRGYQGLAGMFGGLLACGWIHALASTALVALATWYGVRRIPLSLTEQSQLEMSPWQAWWKIRFPLALPWTLVGLLGTAAFAATEMTVVDLYGFRTLADEFYLYYAVDPSATAVIMTCLMPLVVGLAIVGLHVTARRQRISVRYDHEGSHAPDAAHKVTVLAAAVIALGVAALVLLVPLTGLLVKAGHEVVVQDGERLVSWSLWHCLEVLGSAPTTFAAEYRWTLMLAALTSAAAVVLAWPLAAMGRTRRRLELEWVFDIASVVLVLIPGPIVGLAVVRLFQLPLPGFETLYQSTLVPTIVALLFRAGPVAYWIMRAGYRGMDDAMLAAARLDVGSVGRLWTIDRPLIWRNLVVAGFAAAIVASGDVPATLPVVPPGVTTVGTRLFGLLHSGARYQEAALAFWYVAAIVAVAAGLATWMRPAKSFHAEPSGNAK